ncbi:putative ABC transporter ATP-binding protein/MT1014 [bacterium BMS3Abin01]|nr:putative ABC transporter ATP-binding protein/MT1014 [bacterium BMS3Abin01]
MPPETLIQLDSVNKDYQMGEVTVHALRDMELSLPAGVFTVLLGPSGCGKTTTLNLIGGLDRPTSGRVLVQGRNIAVLGDKQLTGYRREQVGFIFQFFNLIPTLNARENVEFALALRKDQAEIKGRALELLDMVGLKDRSGHFPSQLSGGEQQRVAIARALANDSSVILCDEPAGNLDVETGRHVLSVLHDMIQDRGTTVIMVTHNTALAPMADSIVHIHDGSVASIEQNDNPVDASQLEW